MLSTTHKNYNMSISKLCVRLSYVVGLLVFHKVLSLRIGYNIFLKYFFFVLPDGAREYKDTL